ncbi:MAG: amidase, partial [Sphingosinicella sp.]|uniref:amidase n=1 Tax=Sphingosinicella sp. TaxID=1917971 RepID=UPI004037B09A
MNRVLLLGLAASSLSACATILPSDEARMPSDAAMTEPASAEARVRQSLARIEALNPRLNAVIAVDSTALDQARALDGNPQARGPLFGMPVLIKDNIETRGPLPTTAGSLALRDNVTGRDAPLVARLRANGAVIVGKANLSEWANIRSSDSISGWSAIGGQARNPYALNRNPCGSSSGSAVAVAAGMVPAAIGTETDGSITCPAAINGIVGFKPSVGLVSRTHVVPISHSQDTPGPMTRTVRDAALIMNAIVGSDAADPATAEADARRVDYAAALSPDALRGRRIGVMRFSAGFGTDAPFEAALATLRAQGAELVEIREFAINRGEIGRNEIVVLLAELRHDLNAYLATLPPQVRTRPLADLIAFNREHAAEEMPLFGQDLFERAEASGGLDEAWRAARETSLRLAGAEGIDRLLGEHNVVALVAPTRPAAWLIDAVHGDASPGGGVAGTLAAVAGYPHLTVPMGEVRGLPVGLSFIGPR